jgi:hypothetical protein
MHKEERARARAVIGEISSYDPYTRYCVDNVGMLHVSTAKGLTPEQKQLVRANKALLVEYLTSKPEQEGQCARGHAVNWKLDNYGNWLCACYFAEQPVIKPVEQPGPATNVVSMRDYWNNSRASSQGQGKKKDDSTRLLPSQTSKRAI